MARFRNQSGVVQVLRLPSTHFVKNENGIFYNEAAPKTIAEPEQVLETSVELDIDFLRKLTREREVRNRRGEMEKKPGFFVEL